MDRIWTRILLKARFNLNYQKDLIFYWFVRTSIFNSTIPHTTKAVVEQIKPVTTRCIGFVRRLHFDKAGNTNFSKTGIKVNVKTKFRV